MARASKPCGEVGCPNLKPCEEHAAKAWAGSAHRERTMSGSAEQKRSRFVIDRDDGVCHVCGKAGSDQADHVIPLSRGGKDDVENMKAIHAEPCHRLKTAAEASGAQ